MNIKTKTIKDDYYYYYYYHYVVFIYNLKNITNLIYFYMILFILL